MSASNAPTDNGQVGIAEGLEFAFAAEDFREIANLVHTNTGIRVPEYKAAMVYARLARRLRALGLDSFREYCLLVVDNQGVDERQRMVAGLTTNMPSFFGEPHQFLHLRQKVLPPLLESARRGGRVRIWSAACSSGEEPYSIALAILSILPEAPQLDVKILASDLNPDLLHRARKGIYPARALAAVEAEPRRRWFAPATAVDGEPALAACEELRSLIVFRELDLVGEWPMRGTFQAIFCRNVMIYFEEATRDRIWARFIRLLTPNGILYTGPSEALCPMVTPRFAQEEAATYRLVNEGNRLSDRCRS